MLRSDQSAATRQGLTVHPPGCDPNEKGVKGAGVDLHKGVIGALVAQGVANQPGELQVLTMDDAQIGQMLKPGVNLTGPVKGREYLCRTFTSSSRCCFRCLVIPSQPSSPISYSSNTCRALNRASHIRTAMLIMIFSRLPYQSAPASNSSSLLYI